MVHAVKAPRTPTRSWCSSTSSPRNILSSCSSPPATSRARRQRVHVALRPHPGDPASSKGGLRGYPEGLLTKLGVTYSAIGKLVDKPGFAECAAACVGLDGRAIRKMVASAIAT